MLFAISLMNLFGVSGNLMSLGALDFGLIVDGAVIIVESVIHRIHGSKHHPMGIAKLSRGQMDAEVYDSARRMMGFASFGQIIILIVYLPILALTGIEGKMFKPMAQTVAFAILGAFLLSLTYVPMMASLLLSRKTTRKVTFSDRLMGAINRAYQPLLNLALRGKGVVLGVAVGLFAVALLLFTRMGGEFIPQLDEGDFAIETRVLTGSSLQETIGVVQKASAILKQRFPEVEEVVTKIGSAEVPTEPNPVELGDMIVVLKDRDAWTSAGSREELATKISDTLHAHLPQASFGVQQPIQMRFNELMTGARQDVVVKIYGEDLDTLAAYAERLGKLIGPVAGAQDLYVEKMTGLPQIMVGYNRENLARYGLSVHHVNRTITAAFAGEEAGQVYEGEKRFGLVVRMDEQHRGDIADVRNLFVSNAAGLQVPLDQLARVEMREGPNQIQRDAARRRISVGFNVRNRDVESTVDEIRGKVAASLPLPPGYSITYGGQFQNLVEAKSRLSVAVPLALLMIFILLFFAFRSVKQSVLIFTAIPLSAIGGVFALLLRGMPFSISAGVGFIALFGVAVLNGIVLIGYFNQLKESGLTDIEAIVRKGTAARLRPIVMTATVASLGFLPMALSSSAGAEVQKPLATVVIGGLVSATLLTLVVLPVIYYFSERGLRPAKALPVLLLLGVPLAGYGQGPQPVGLEQVLRLAHEHNERLRRDRLAVDLQGTLKRTAVDLPKTGFNFAHGELNSPLPDNRIGITQSFSFPGAWTAQRRLLAGQQALSEKQRVAGQREVELQIRQTYGRLAYLHELGILLQRQDSLYAAFEKAAEAKVRTGESGLLELTTAQTQRLELLDRLSQHGADTKATLSQLNALIQAPEPLDLIPEPLEAALPVDLSFLPPADHPLLAPYEQVVTLAERAQALEKKRLLPDFSLGYFNQSLSGSYVLNGQESTFGRSNRFQGVEAGIALPLWFGPQSARIKAAGIRREMALAEWRNEQKRLQGEWQAAVTHHQRLRNSLALYRDKVQPNARLSVAQADKAYRGGEAGYLQYLQATDAGLRVQQHYLQLLLDYQLHVYQLNYLSGQ
jgi:cobalt-zinc-cadmium resistance protein CzcA